MRQDLVTRRALIDVAVAAGYGTPTALGKLFNRWRTYGLIGNPVRKAPRRGGEGLWHPLQGRLWTICLEQRKMGTRVSTLANLPVGAWLLKSDGVTADQAQRTLAFWAAARAMPVRPSGDRSLRRRAADATARKIAAPASSKAAVRALRRRLEALFDGIPHLNISQESMAIDLMAAVSTAREAPESVRRAAASIYGVLSYRFLALEHIDTLCASDAGIHDLWRWTQDVVCAMYPAYAAVRPVLATDADTGHLYESPTVQAFVNAACPTALTVFGMGIRNLQGVGVWPPIIPEPDSALAPRFGEGRYALLAVGHAGGAGRAAARRDIQERQKP